MKELGGPKVIFLDDADQIRKEVAEDPKLQFLSQLKSSKDPYYLVK